jgi:hypothetical protein
MELRYTLRPDAGPPKTHTVVIDDQTYATPEPEGPAPDWTRLEHQKCADCPLNEASSPRCPVAVRIAPLVEKFKDSVSYEEAEVTVESSGRAYSKRVPMQIGVSGLFGLVMATSGCPILDKLRPMVFTHLPFPSLQETMYRSMSMYLLAQYFIEKKGGAPDRTLEGLADIFARIGRVNQSIAERLRPLVPRDATINAVINLDCFATFTKSAIDKQSLAWLERLFKPYWDAPKA